MEHREARAADRPDARLDGCEDLLVLGGNLQCLIRGLNHSGRSNEKLRRIAVPCFRNGPGRPANVFKDPMLNDEIPVVAPGVHLIPIVEGVSLEGLQAGVGSFALAET
eukprot:6657578-Alexandrium_andersonii.AAC.1